jgi:hypothetical protein
MAKTSHLISIKPLTPTQRAFLMSWIAYDGNGVKAALNACGCSTPEAAAVCASRLLRNDNIKRAIEEEMEKQGLGIFQIVRKLTSGLDSASMETCFKVLEMILKLTGSSRS